MFKLNRVITSAIVGNALEWYDYLLYAYFASIIGTHFFPSSNVHTSLILTFAVFAVGFIARPIGGMVFGYIGDEYGRKVALTFSIALIAIPTTAIGLLPGYERIGMFAPILLVIMRILQGISLGGEFSASSTFLVESAPDGKKGFFGSFSTASIGLGMMLVSLSVFALNLVLTKEEIADFGWRIPFLLSFVIGFIGFYIRKNLSESHEFIAAKESNKLSKTPFKTIFVNHKAALITCVAIFMTITIPIYTIAIFSKTMMVAMLGYDEKIASLAHVMVVAIFTLTAPFFGYLSDKINGKKILLVSAIATAICIYPFISALISGNLVYVFTLYTIMGVLIGAYQGVVPTLFVTAFPVAVRSSGVSLSYNIPAVLFGGTAPMILTLFAKHGGLVTTAYYVIFGCLCSTISLIYLLRKPNN